MDPKKMVLVFRPDPEKAETKNTFKFAEVPPTGQPPKIGTLYVQKWVFDGVMPQEITVTLEVK